MGCFQGDWDFSVDQITLDAYDPYSNFSPDLLCLQMFVLPKIYKTAEICGNYNNRKKITHELVFSTLTIGEVPIITKTHDHREIAS